jgi:hypothetical protein
MPHDWLVDRDHGVVDVTTDLMLSLAEAINPLVAFDLEMRAAARAVVEEKLYPNRIPPQS